MKILIVRPSPNKMNLLTYNLQEIGLAKALIRRGHVCDVMYYCGNERDHKETITFDGDKSLIILWLHGIGFLREGIYPSLRKYADEYDIIQVGGYVGLTSCWLNRKYQDKVVNYQGPYYCKDNKGDNQKAVLFDRMLLPLQNKSNMIVATKSNLATEYVKKKGIKNVVTIGVGLDLDNLTRQTEDNDFVKKLKKENGNKKLLYIGVLEERRNILFLLETFKKVVEKDSNYKLVLIGKGKAEYMSLCKTRIEELGLRDKIIYRESLEQKYMPSVYQSCDAFLLPTRYEIFGMVLLEAMYYKLPVFTTYNGGSSTLMNKGNGIIINELDTHIWSKTILDILENDSLCNDIGEAAHRTVAEDYTWDALAEKFLNVYNMRINYAKGKMQ